MRALGKAGNMAAQTQRPAAERQEDWEQGLGPALKPGAEGAGFAGGLLGLPAQYFAYS